ncbi:MAG: fatty acyl-AMP ligase, partial [Pseudomonadales bacterium]|nr:fatty acyl-AMP ligase [Pseudomonadales bacterium]
MVPTTTRHQLPFRAADFATLAEALDYAAQGATGANFYSGRGELRARLSYRSLRRDAVMLARKMLALGLNKGDRVALIAETDPHFLRFFYACQYAGLVPVPLPASVKLGAHTSYVAQLRGLLSGSHAAIAVASPGYLPYLEEAGAGLGLRRIAEPEAFYQLPAADDLELPQPDPDGIAYIQYTSGSTRFPRGVVIPQRTAMANLAGIVRHGVKLAPGDRCLSWLPFYHDMGLVGFVLVPVAAQTSVDYLDTRDFAMRPRQWLNLMSETKATVSFAPPFGYDLCARRLVAGEAARYDLRHWRVAGVGAEMIRPEILEAFAEALAPAGFDRRAFLACYGMAECTLGISFSPLYRGFRTTLVDTETLYDQQLVVPLDARRTGTTRGRYFVNCGIPLPGYEVQIRGEDAQPLAEYQTGVIHLRGPSVMAGYFEMPEETRAVLDPDGWLNTGDIGYLAEGSLTITGRQKDLIIIRGRNIWPQDIEHIAETQPEVRSGGAVAFAAPDAEGDDTCVLLVECRETQPERRAELSARLAQLVQRELALECRVELVPMHHLPRTSSGKLS